MASDAFNEIIQRAEKLTPAEVVDLIAWLESRKSNAPKRSIISFKPGVELPGKGSTEWVDELRSGWDR